MNINNIEEFLQWLVSSKDIAVGDVSGFLNDKSEDEINALVDEYKSVSSFKIGGKIESAAEMFKCGGKTKKKVKKGEFGMVAPQKTISHSRGKDSLHTMPGKNNTIDSIGFIKPQDPRIKGGEYSVKKDGTTGVYSGFYDNIFGDYRQLSAEEARRLFRDLVNRINSVPQKQEGGELLRRKDLKKEAKENYGYNGKQFRDAYRNSIAAYQNKGYKRSKAKEFAQDILTREKQDFVPAEDFNPVNPKHGIVLNFNHKPLVSPINLPESKMLVPSFEHMDGFEPMIRYHMGHTSNADKKPAKVSVKNVDIPMTEFGTQVIDDNVIMPIPSFGDNGALIDEIVVEPNYRTNFDNIKDFFRRIRFAKPNLRWYQSGGVIKDNEIKKKVFFLME